MLYSKQKVAKAVLVLIFFTVVLIGITLVSLNNGRNGTRSLRSFVSEDTSTSPESIDEALQYFIYGAKYLLAAVKSTVSDNSANITAVSHSITVVKDRMQMLLSEFEHHLHRTEILSFLSLPVINNHNFSYIYNREDICSKKAVKLVFVVPSAPGNVEKRQTVRKGSRGDYVRKNANNTILLFFLGKPSPGSNYLSLQTKIDEEVKEFGDIIQADFEDVYSNNRLKSVSMLRWISTYCSTAKFVIRADDDVNITTVEVVSALERAAETLSNFIIGHKLIADRPSRNVKNKYYLSKKEYPPPTFPPYLLGGLLVYPVSTAKLLYQAALRVKPIWLEDVYITGICATKVYIPILSDPGVVFQHRKS
ncbi:unnamed protein product [Candidula unifasciata]|uniref:Hexosyltransferase n=1 Tax=Candidula unifasciata TaxID=100452 RepID=A0A8S3Z5Q8_9EUPU|nr:unnamed protein product [Candidula unifasciata]